MKEKRVSKNLMNAYIELRDKCDISTFKRLSKRYGEERPENMFLEDETYRIFLNDMRTLLQNEVEFKNKYCEHFF